MSPFEYDLHGIVGVRLEDASEEDVAAVDRQLGPIRAPLDRPPDLIIRFVDGAPPDEISIVVPGESGRAGDEFLVLRSKHKVPARVALPLDRIGEPGVEIVVRRGAPAVPFLIACVNLVALGHGALPLHASAFVDGGVGVLVTGWSKGGKTEALLAFVSRGAEYVGDEWVYLLPGGALMAGIPEPIRVWDWQLQQLPEVRRMIGAGDRLRIGAVGAALGLASRLGRQPSDRGWGGILERQRCVDVAPQRLFGKVPRLEPVSIDRVCFVGTHLSKRTELNAISADEVASRMTWSLRYEQLPLWTLYQEYRYAFPHRRNALLENGPLMQSQRLAEVLHDHPSFSVLHPYPVDLGELHRAIRTGIAAS